MTPFGAFGLLLSGFFLGFVAGLFVTLAHPIYLKAWHDCRKAKESRKKANQSFDTLLGLIQDKAVREHQAGAESRAGTLSTKG